MADWRGNSDDCVMSPISGGAKLEWMSIASELAELFHRDLTRLSQELIAFPDDSTLWMALEGISNSAGNLVLHLEGNLREYIGRQLGNIPYVRRRELEFSSSGLSSVELVKRIDDVRAVVPPVIAGLSEQALAGIYPEKVINREWTTQQFLLHLYAHFNYHLGQIDYLRRVLTKDTAVKFATL